MQQSRGLRSSSHKRSNQLSGLLHLALVDDAVGAFADLLELDEVLQLGACKRQTRTEQGQLLS